MFQGPAARAVVSALAAVLLALPFFALTTSFASAHTARQILAQPQPGNIPSGMAVREETVSCQETGRPGAPAGPLRPRDRHRATATAPARSPGHPPSGASAALPEQVVPGAHRSGAPRPPDDRSPAVLQVFRC